MMYYMPELPEVETVVRQLRKKIKGRRIKEIEVNFGGRIRDKDGMNLADLIGREVLDVERRAKLIIWKFGVMNLVSHLKMTGKWLSEPSLPERHLHAKFAFDDGQVLYWSDVRKFGYLELMTAEELEEKLGDYGLEPLETDARDLVVRLQENERKILKAALLDQSIIAGIGNIYADEACFAAGILPSRRVGDLNEVEINGLVVAIKNILSKAVEMGGTTANNYMSVDGKRGEFVNFLKVYGRKEKNCVECNAIIERLVLVGRGTHICLKCQR
jgi:formamidopyrimidine-DNA glycosylase